MYTRCPKCSTCFRVTDRHLAIAKGKVRCGQCQLVFNAPENAIDDLPINAQASNKSDPDPIQTQTTKPKAPLAPTQAEKDLKAGAAAIKDKTEKPVKATEIKKPTDPIVSHLKVTTPVFNANATIVADINSLNKDEIKSIDLDVPNTSSTSSPPITSKSAQTAQDDDLFNNDFDLDAAINELTQATEDSYKNEKEITKSAKKPATTESEKYLPSNNQSADIFTTDAYNATNATSVADILNEMEGQLSLDIAEPIHNVNDDKFDADDEFEFIELDNETGTNQENQHADETNDETLKKSFNLKEFGFDENELKDNTPKSKSIKEAPIDGDELFDGIEEEIISEDSILNNSSSEKAAPNLDKRSDKSSNRSSDKNSDNSNVSFQLRHDLERLQAPSQRRLHPLLKFSFIIVLLALSFSQVAYFRAHELVNLIPSSLPLLEAYCEKVGCQYSGPRDTKQIQLISRDVRQHPKEKNALLISAAMINNAPFAQPYPDIHIRLSDISGNVVAERIFNAKTYMGKLSNPFLLMKSKIPVHINFEVVDPGKDAVNFEFTFL